MMNPSERLKMDLSLIQIGVALDRMDREKAEKKEADRQLQEAIDRGVELVEEDMFFLTGW